MNDLTCFTGISRNDFPEALKFEGKLSTINIEEIFIKEPDVHFHAGRFQIFFFQFLDALLIVENRNCLSRVVSAAREL
jgi:hypothetical protein